MKALFRVIEKPGCKSHWNVVLKHPASEPHQCVCCSWAGVGLSNLYFDENLHGRGLRIRFFKKQTKPIHSTLVYGMHHSKLFFKVKFVILWDTIKCSGMHQITQMSTYYMHPFIYILHKQLK